MADNFQDLTQALGMLQQGVQGLALQRAITGANDQVQQIRDSELKDNEKMSQLRGVAQSLTMHMAGMGVAPDRIAQVAERIAPNPSMMQTPEQAVLNGSPDQVSAGHQLIQQGFEQKKELAEMMATGKLAKEARGTLGKFQGDFNKELGPMQKAQEQAANAISLLQSGNKVTPGAIKVLMARARGDVGRISDAERNVFAGRQDTISKLERWMSVGATSDLPAEDKVQLSDLAKQYLAVSDNAQQQIADKIAGQASANSLFSGVDMDSLVRQISGGKYQKYTNFGRNAGATGQQPTAPTAGVGAAGAGQPSGGILNYLRPIGGQ